MAARQEESPVAFLKNGINVKDLMSPDGVVFEIDDVNMDSQSEDEDDKVYFDNEGNFADLFLGISDKDKVRTKYDWVNMSFDEISKDMKPICADRGVLKRVLKEGHGEVMPPKSVVHCHYNSFLEKQAEPFDSSRLRNFPLKFILGDGKVLAGFDLAVSSMRKGEIAEYIVNHTYAFGKLGCPPRVQPEASIFYVIEVINFEGTADLMDENVDGLAPEDQTKFNYDKVTNQARIEHLQGNEKMKEQSYQIAKTSYRKALRMLENLNFANETQQNETEKLMKKLHLNLSQCYIYLKEPGLASFHAKRVIEVDPRNSKALYRCGKANRILGEYEEANRYLKRALKLEPKDELIIREIQLNERDKAAYLNRQRLFCLKMMGNDTSKDEEEKFEVTEHFKKAVRENLQKFLENEELDTYPCHCGFSQDEINYVAKLGKEMGLDCVYTINCETKLKLIKVPSINT